MQHVSDESDGRKSQEPVIQEPVTVDGRPLLTSIEAENLHLIALHGFNLAQLAEYRCKSVHTINRQIYSAKLKLGIHGRSYVAAVLEAARLGLIPSVGPNRGKRDAAEVIRFSDAEKD